MTAISGFQDARPPGPVPPGLAADGPASLDGLVARLAMPAARRLFDEVVAGDGSPRGRHLRGLLLNRLNGARPARAQRLFTSLFDPFLCPDAGLLAAPFPVPWAITRPDVAALWQVLAAVPLRRLLVQVTAELDLASRDQLVDDALAGPQGRRRRDEMAAIAIAALETALTSASATRDLCSLIDSARRPWLDGALAAAARPVARADLVQIVALLRLGPLAAPQVALVRRRLTGDVGQFVVVAEAQAVVATLLGAGRAADAAIVPAVALHARAAYLPVAAALARRPSDPATRDAVTALLGHYAACVQDLVALLSRPADCATRRDAADAGLARHGRIRHALHDTGLAAALGEPLRARLRAIAAPLDDLVERVLCPDALAQAAADAPTAGWLCGWIRRWEGQMRHEGVMTTFTIAWRARLALVLEDGVRHAITDAGTLTDAQAAGRLGRLARLARLHATAGLDIAEALPVTSRTLLAICEAGIHAQFRGDGGPDRDERAVIAVVVARVRAEMARTRRRWASAGHQHLAALAVKAGY